MKILIDGRLISIKPTGISRYTLELIKSYNCKYGPENVTILLNNKLNFLNENKFIYTNLKPFNLLHFFLFPYLIHKNKINLFHSPFYSSVWIRNKNIFIISTVHDLMFYKVKNFIYSNKTINYFAKIYYLVIVKSSLFNSDIIISVSDTTKNDIKDIFNIDSFLISEGINLDNFNSLKTSLPNNLQKNMFFLYVGNGRRHKNLDFLVSTFELYKGDKKLVIIGNRNPKYDDKKNIIQLLNIDDDELQLFYKNCSAFIFPSLYEGFGLPVLEALSFKSIVFSSNAGALAEFKFKSLFFFDPKCKDELLKLMNLVDELKFNDFDLILLKEYNWKNNFNKLHDILYEKL
jgi:glycosyltransferase involved in cell wall biosynthesis